MRAERSRRSLYYFVREGWHVIEPDVQYVDGFHVPAICQHLEAVTFGRILRLLITVPPGHMKSLLVSVFWLPWVWLHRPARRSLFASYAMDLSTRDSVRCRDVILSEWYQSTFRPSWTLKWDQNVKTWFENDARGLRMALAVGGKGTGFRGDCVVFDDAHNVKARPSEDELEDTKHWWDKRMSSRLNDPRRGARVGIGQRVHVNDLPGHCIAKGGYEHLNLPTLFRPEKRCRTSIGWEDPRQEHDELLFPGMYTREVIAEARRDLGERDFAGQHQQEPVPSGGTIVKSQWLRFWYPRGATPPSPVRVETGEGEQVACVQREVPESFARRFSSWDMSFKDKSRSAKGRGEVDYVAGGDWAQAGADLFLLDQVHDRMDFVRTLKEVVALANRRSGWVAHLIEDAANGPAILSALQAAVPGMVAISPIGGKEARLQAAAPRIEAGNVYLPHPALYPWVYSLIHELTGFKFAKHDDQADQVSQAINWTIANPIHVASIATAEDLSPAAAPGESGNPLLDAGWR